MAREQRGMEPMEPPQHPWMRQPNETEPAYRAFRSYMTHRTIPGVCEDQGKSRQLISLWSANWSWLERVRAFDVHLLEAQTDGLVHQMAESRDKNLALMDKLRGLLDSRLDTFIIRKEDPTIRWTQAVMAMAKIEANSLALKQDVKTDERIGKIEELVERALREEEADA